jgi:RNA polymerase sigma-70 factor (ECF subfamily)
MNSGVNNTYQIELVKRTSQGDISAFHEIVELYKKKVYYIAYNICGDFHEAEDISQEVFIKVFRFINKFRSDAKLSTWIYQVSVNTSIDAVRKRKKKQVFMETAQMDSLPPDSTVTGSNTAGPENLTARDLFRQRIHQALPGLSKKERAVFVMRYLNEFKLLEIAEIQGISINSIKTLLLRAKKKLRKKLAPYNQEYGWSTYPEVPNE